MNNPEMTWIVTDVATGQETEITEAMTRELLAPHSVSVALAIDLMMHGFAWKTQAATFEAREIGQVAIDMSA